MMVMMMMMMMMLLLLLVVVVVVVVVVILMMIAWNSSSAHQGLLLKLGMFPSYSLLSQYTFCFESGSWDRKPPELNHDTN